MPSWSFKLEGQVLDGMEIVSASHVNVEKETFDPHRGVCCAMYDSMLTGLNPSGNS